MNHKNQAESEKIPVNLSKVVSGAEELFYNPRSGKLSVAKQGAILNDPDRVPATQMAREGFFRGARA